MDLGFDVNHNRQQVYITPLVGTEMPDNVTPNIVILNQQ